MPAAGDMVQLRLHGRIGAEPIINDLSFAAVADYGTFPQLAQGLIAEVDTAIGIITPGGPWTGGLSTGYTLESVEVADVYPGTAAGFQRSSGVSGAATADAMPPNDALCITLRSDFRGPGGRGRMYLTGFSEDSASGGFWEAGAQDAAGTIASALDTAFGEFGTGSFRWCILHRYSNGGVLHAPVVKLAVPEIKPIMDWTVHNEVCSIGRRAVGRRIHRTRVTV
jgi:hypothetical protein